MKPSKAGVRRKSPNRRHHATNSSDRAASAALQRRTPDPSREFCKRLYRDGEWAERGEVTLDAAAKIIGVHKMTVLRMIKRGDIKGRQPCPEAPWVIKDDDVAAFAVSTRTKHPVTPNPDQATFDFQ